MASRSLRNGLVAERSTLSNIWRARVIPSSRMSVTPLGTKPWSVTPKLLMSPPDPEPDGGRLAVGGNQGHIDGPAAPKSVRSGTELDVPDLPDAAVASQGSNQVEADQVMTRPRIHRSAEDRAQIKAVGRAEDIGAKRGEDTQREALNEIGQPVDLDERSALDHQVSIVDQQARAEAVRHSISPTCSRSEER